MTFPLIALAVLAFIGGFIGIPALFSGEGGNAFENWLEPVFKNADARLAQTAAYGHSTEITLMVVSVILGVAGIIIARNIYLKKTSIATNLANKFKGLHNLLWNKYFVDEVYDATVVTPIVKTSDSFLWKITDAKIIDGAVNGAAAIVDRVSKNIRKIQTGVAQFYAVIMTIGIVLALFWIIMSL
jgi:NADH-quinone oxidoreductase subunit L